MAGKAVCRAHRPARSLEPCAQPGLSSPPAPLALCISGRSKKGLGLRVGVQSTSMGWAGGQPLAGSLPSRGDYVCQSHLPEL